MVNVGNDRADFVARSPHIFLVKVPVLDTESQAKAGLGGIVYKTRHVSEEALVDAAAFSGQWWVGAIKKRPENPFPDRISVGRATNCDVVVRVSFVSKLHAHFLVGPGGELRVQDQRSANGTRLNGRELPAGISATVVAGDTVCFGAVELKLMNAGALFDLLGRS